MTQPWEKNWARLPLDAAVNARELGGYPASEGRPTLYHRFLRSDALDELSDYDREFLYGYGVRAVLDLRGVSEKESSPDLHIGEGVVYEHISLFEFDISDQEEFERAAQAGEYSAQDVYRTVVHNEQNVARCMRFIANAPEGCVLFHCAVGKDRTGILAYLLMSLAGCDRWDCLSSYMTSRVNLMRDPWFITNWDREMSHVRRGHLDSRTETLEFAIDLIDEEYGGVVPYLLQCGVTFEEMEIIRARMLDE